MVSGINDSMILTDQFLALILRDFTEFIIHILDFTLAVCQGYNGGFIQGKFQVTQLMQEPFNLLRNSLSVM